MKAESVSGSAPCLSRQGAIRRALFAVSLAIASCVALLLATPAANAERIVGTDGDDHILGTPKSDRIQAGAGDDDVSALRGVDEVMGGLGNDTLRLGPNMGGIEQAQGGFGNDTIFGGRGRDDIQDGDGRDEVHGGRGADLFLLDSGIDSWHAGPGDDSFVVFPDGRPDQIACGPGRDTVRWEFRREALDQTTGCEREGVI